MTADHTRCSSSARIDIVSCSPGPSRLLDLTHIALARINSFISCEISLTCTIQDGNKPASEKKVLFDVVKGTTVTQPRPRAPRSDVTLYQGASVRLSLTSASGSDSGYKVTSANAAKGTCKLDGNHLTYTAPTDYIGLVQVTCSGKHDTTNGAHKAQDKTLIVNVIKADAILYQGTSKELSLRQA